ncbi:hypothetical protein [Vibrio sagamiensis]|uniref:Gp5/Type VI secretion system Vgr protein OB-fold domain-containing protein n=1 Tax=Vibrio sagamiensis NBRC 104589 TaxID=1219064 RepID=A0A511QJ37_9VIBR|nr:hypothetical protein [Vibrio sagamiensis]PNQ69301.1 hypothetical protein C1141_06220 [Vibrio agarivorans]GEM77345.1 hypothetical protein VSA01S_34570 [Vibrio sagamiensis NBRC 104589]
MKLNQRLTINGEPQVLVDAQVILELCAGGRATFVVKGEVKPNDLVLFDIGYEAELVRYFDGYVSKAQPAQNGFTRFIARERAGLLASRWPVSIQHATISEIIEQLSFDTGLDFVLPEQDYVYERIANFTSQGSGYQLLSHIGRAFQLEDFVWFQQSDGQIYLGEFTESRWHSRPITIDPALAKRAKNGESMTLAVMPSVRPGVVLNDKRITQVHLQQGNMTLYWAQGPSSEKRKMHYLFPELAAGHHLPKLARVVAITDQSQAGQENHPFRPRYAVDVQLLDQHGRDDALVPLYKAVPLPTGIGGPEQGQLAMPTEGSIVEIAFAYGCSDKPFIRTVLGDGWPLPSLAPGEQRTQQRHEVYWHTDAAGHHRQSTDQTRLIEAFQTTERAEQHTSEFGLHELCTVEHSQEFIGGQKRIEAMGAIDVLAGDTMNLATLESMHLASGGEWAQVIGQLRDVVVGLDDKLTVLGNQVIKVEKDIEASAKNMRFSADLITMNGGKGVVQGDCICAYTGKPHSDLSSTVKAGK